MSNLTHYTLPLPAGELTDLQWDIVSVTGGDTNFGAITKDKVEYDLVFEK